MGDSGRVSRDTPSKPSKPAMRRVCRAQPSLCPRRLLDIGLVIWKVGDHPGNWVAPESVFDVFLSRDTHKTIDVDDLAVGLAAARE